jgi:two-component system sensor histidine kinase KdpD
MAAWIGAVLVPPALTAVLYPTGHLQRDYIFLYLGAVAVLGLLGGLWPALLAAAFSFLLVDYFFVPPVGTLTIADREDIVNLLAFAATGLLVGLLASRRRRALLESRELAGQLRDANSELVRLNAEQASAAQSAVRLARSEQQIRSLQETDRLRRELLANVSHELRTPLGTILAESTDTAGRLSAGDAARRLDTIAAEARRLDLLVEDMLDMARIESGALELDLEPVLLQDAVVAAAERLQHGHPDRKVSWDRDETSTEVLVDWDRLGQILDNLLENANRFGPAGTPIRIAVSHEEPDLVTVRVSDQGPGVPLELRDRIFHRFVRGPDGPDQGPSPGTGLGLAIVKALVEAHAGTIRLEEPAAGKGATFTFTLPEAPAPG